MKLDRLMGIVTVLMQNEKTTAPRLAERFEVSRRTIQRDIQDICAAGIPIVTVQGARGGISIAEGYKLDKTLFTVEDLKAILTGLKGLDSIAWTPKYRRIMAKLSADQASVQDQGSHLAIDLSSHYKDSLAPKIEYLQSAIAEKRCVKFQYYYSKGESEKIVEPHLVVFRWSAWYLAGYCCEKKEFRLYKLNRMWKIETVNAPFRARKLPEKLFDAYFKDEIVLEALFDERVKYRLVEEYGVDSFSETKEKRLYFKKGFADREYLIQWILSFGGSVELLSPQELRSEIKQCAQAILSRYSEA